jgi:hypothetical protein
MATTNSEMSTPENPDGAATAETENLNSIYEFREALWETSIRPMRSPLLGQTRPEGVGPASGMKKNSKLGGPHEEQTT